MRLTPSWLRSSSEDPGGDRSDDSDALSGVTVYHSPPDDLSTAGADVTERAGEFVPESNAALLAALEEMETPVTVDEIADELIRPARPSVEIWAAVHQRLHENRLPELAASDEIVFDESQGLVERPATRTRVETASSRSVLGSESIDPRITFFVLFSLSVLSATAIAFVAMNAL